MSEPNIKIQVSLNDSKISSTVPEEQKIRDAVSVNNFVKVAAALTIENPTDAVDISFKTDPKIEHVEKSPTDEVPQYDSLTEVSKEDFVLTPVMKVTKEEAVLTKGDLKLQKVSVTEDISEPRVTTATEQENVDVINDEQPEKQTQVITLQQVRPETQSDEIDQVETRKPKTRIPTLRFRQAVDKLRQDRKSFEDKKKEPETPQPIHSRSSIPRLKDGKNGAPNTNDSTPKKVETADLLPRLSDEFDKLYDEIAKDQDSLETLSLGSRIEDPVKLDNTFEEIIHAYEENKIQPINIEKTRQSKIPLLKRKSEPEIEVPKYISPKIGDSISVDLDKIKSSEIIPKSHSKTQSVAFNKRPTESSNQNMEVPNTTSSVNQESISIDLDKIKPSEIIADTHSKVQAVTLNKTFNKSSENEIELPKETSPEIKESTSGDLDEIKISEIITENHSRTEAETLNKNPIESIKHKMEMPTQTGPAIWQNISVDLGKIESSEITTVNHSKLQTMVTSKSLIGSSEPEVEVPKWTTPVTRQSISVDLGKLKTSETTTENYSKMESVTYKKGPFETSKHEKEMSKQSSPVLRQSISVDLSKIKTLDTKVEKNSKIQSVTLNKSPIRTSLISRRISEIKSVQESSTGYFEKNVSTVEKPNNIDANFVKKEISKEAINKSSKVNSNTNNFTAMENIEMEELAMPPDESVNPKIKHNTHNIIIHRAKSVEQNTLTPKEEKRIRSFSPTKISIERVYNNPVKTENVITSTDQSPNIEVVLENKNEENIPTIRGKVNRIIKRIDSNEVEVKPSKRDFGDQIPKEKSVLSKIAMFQNPKSDPTSIKSDSSPTSNSKLEEPTETDNKFSNDQPPIIEEVLKALPPRVLRVYHNEQSDNNNNTPATEVDSSDNECTSHIKIIDIQPQIISLTAEPVENTVSNTDQNSMPTHIEEDSISSNTFDVQIVDLQPKVPVQSTNIQESGLQSENEHTPMAIDNNLDYKGDIQNSSLNINGNQKIDPSEVFLETEAQWKAEQDMFYNKHYNTIQYYEGLKSPEPLSTNSKPKIISNIKKQEVKYEHPKIAQQLKEKENGVFQRGTRKEEGQLRIHSYRNNELNNKSKSTSLADLDLDVPVKGRVKNLIVRMKSLERLDVGKKEIIDIKERPRKRSVSEKIALFERKLTPVKIDKYDSPKIEPKQVEKRNGLSEEEYAEKIEDLSMAKTKFGGLDPGKMKYLDLRDGGKMPAIGIGTALLDPKLARYVVKAAIDLGYRTIDTAYLYGNEKEVGEAINEKINDGTVSRSELFIISKLWSTFHRQDLVQHACRASLDAMGLDYFDLYLIHNPMSFKEGGDLIPKIASVLQFSEHDYLDAWFGVERLVRDGLVKRGGVSNFNSLQVDRVVEKGKIKPVINQVECHPYLSQHRLEDFCQTRNVKLCTFSVLGSKGTPQEYKSGLPPVIDDPLVRVMAAGLNVSPAALLVSYQLALERGVIVKASSAAHLWDNLQALTLTPGPADISALHALNRNKRIHTFKGLGDTHRNYPFNIPF